MAQAGLSLIFPVFNLEREISGILQMMAAQAADLDAEFLVVDMGSKDGTIVKALEGIAQLHLRGYVIQNGETAVSTALNTGLSRATGKYVSFVFARRMYRDFLPAYFWSAKTGRADLVFGCTSQQESERLRQTEKAQPLSGTDCVKNLLDGKLKVDISALLLRRDFLLEHHLRFADGCSHGYAEEFILRCLLKTGAIFQAPVLLARDRTFELNRDKQAKLGEAIFQRILAMERVLEVLRTDHSGDRALIQKFEQQRLPLAVMNCVDILLREEFNSRAVGSFLKRGGYDRMLRAGKYTDKELRRRIRLWKAAPWLYRPQKKAVVK